MLKTKENTLNAKKRMLKEKDALKKNLINALKKTSPLILKNECSKEKGAVRKNTLAPLKLKASAQKKRML